MRILDIDADIIGNARHDGFLQLVPGFFRSYPQTTRVYIHFDNDNPGRVAGQRLQEALEQKGIHAVQQYPPAGCKDVNDYLVGMNRLQAEKGKRQEAGL